MAGLNVSVLLPLLTLISMVGMILVFDRAGRRSPLSTWFALTGLAAAPLLSLIETISGQGGSAQHVLYSNGSSTLWTLLCCGIGIGIVLIDLEHHPRHGLDHALILLLVCGALIVVQSAHLLALNIGLAMVYAIPGALTAAAGRPRQVILGGIALACVLMGSVCLYGVGGTLNVPVGRPERMLEVTNPLVVLGFNLYVAGVLLLPVLLIGQPSSGHLGDMTRSLFLPMVSLVALKPWIALLPRELANLLQVLGAVGIAVGYGIALRARRMAGELVGVTIAELARLVLLIRLAPNGPLPVYQAAVSVGALMGLWALGMLGNMADDTDGPPRLGDLTGSFKLAATVCLLSLSGMPPLAGSIGQIGVLRMTVEHAMPGTLAAAAIGQMIAWLWAMRCFFRLGAQPSPGRPSRRFSVATGGVLVVAALSCMLLGLYADPLFRWIEHMLTTYRFE